MELSGREQIERLARERGIDEDALKEAVRIEMERRAAERKARREARRANPQPPNGLYAAISSGRYARKDRPHGGPRGARAKLEDRELAGAAVRHWRKVHGLTPRQCQGRIGYSPSSSNWRHWEQGFTAPPYRALLLIIAATGLGHWVDQEQPSHGDPLTDLQVAAREQRELRAQRRRDRTPTDV